MTARPFFACAPFNRRRWCPDVALGHFASMIIATLACRRRRGMVVLFVLGRLIRSPSTLRPSSQEPSASSLGPFPSRFPLALSSPERFISIFDVDFGVLWCSSPLRNIPLLGAHSCRACPARILTALVLALDDRIVMLLHVAFSCTLNDGTGLTRRYWKRR